MTYTLIQARKLLSAAELDVFAASRGESLKTLTAVQLRGKIKRTRTLRDKFTDLQQRQTVATRARTASKSGTSGVANARTAQKAEVFGEVLARYEARLAQLEAAVQRAARKTTIAKLKLAALKLDAAKRQQAAALAPARSAKAPKVQAAAVAGTGLGSERARSARHDQQAQQAGQAKVLAHVAAQGRRSQAKRDGRG